MGSPDVEDTEGDVPGYGTREALSALYEELSAEIEKHKAEKRKNWLKGTLSCFSHSRVQALYHWTTALIILVLVCVVFTAYAVHVNVGNPLSMCSWWLVLCIFLLITVIFNSALNIWSHSMADREYSNIATQVLRKFSDVEDLKWSAHDYPNIYSPLSPCVSLQGVYRDGGLVNLPQPLLVKGDIILIRPGQTAPCKCRELEESGEGQELILMPGDLYAPDVEGCTDSLLGPQGRIPLKAKKFILLETPFVQNMRAILSGEVSRPASILDNERHLLVRVWTERRILPSVVIIMVLTNVLRWMYLDGHVGHWSEMVFILLIHSLVPLLTLVFPVMWLLINIYGQARIFSVFTVARQYKQAVDDSFSSASTISVDEARVDVSGRQVFDWFHKLLTGTVPVVSRQANILHVLGSVTSLCCVDKKGILSWPNPSAEKIFFFTTGPRKKVSRNLDIELRAESDHVDSVFSDIPEDETSKKKKDGTRRNSQSSVQGLQNHIEVLDLTHDAKSSFGLHFDDPSWRKHINSLKPLGLNILLNTCNLSTVDWYQQFSDHVACAALEHEETVAVVNRRCMCDLAKEIGFSEMAASAFTHDECLGMYRQVPAEESAKERVNRAKSFIQHKIPMPNMVSVITEDKNSGMCQLLTQGTADILLDCCTDYWTGQDLCVLSESDKKKIVDFYHRNSMASYCTAFSYRPFSQTISPNLESMYIELPEKFVSAINTTKNNRISETEDPAVMTLLTKSSRSFSVDSLMETESFSSIDDVPGCHQAQNNQIFIGMVTLQYQARQEFVQLIDKLESACIRFVHFSKENELRSRVFSEKMGLEAGWNCHISLMSDNSFKAEGNMSGPGSMCHGEVSQRPSHHSSRHSTDDLGRDQTIVSKSHTEATYSRSLSAPSVVNLEETQVKFDVEVKEDRHSVEIKEDSPIVVSADHEEEEEEEEEKGEREGERQKLMPGPKRQRGWSSSDDEGEGEGVEGETDIQSDSRYTSSYVTDNTDDDLTGALDNRAKLPRGIENIRPHLANIDNVPLLVNLFTDCTAEATQEMMKVMQENGEVVLCVGSSINILNTNLFLQADCSFSIEPLYPQVCAKQKVMSDPVGEGQATPTSLASALVNIPCPLSFWREDNVSLVQLIAEARHFTLAMRNCFYLMLCYHLSLTLAQVLASILLLPPVLDTRHLLWLLLVVVPLLSLTLMGNPVDPRTMTVATRKNKDHVNREMVVQYTLQFFLRFLPSIIVPILCYGLTLFSYCNYTTRVSCGLYSFSDTENVTTVFHNWYEKYSGGIVLAQNINVFLLVFYFACISMSFVHWSDHLWQRLPFTNKLWSSIIPTLLAVQVVYFVADVLVQTDSTVESLPFSHLHPAIWALAFVWPVVIVTINELVKRREIKLAVRHQKRARLDFGTKLGMNSPF